MDSGFDALSALTKEDLESVTHLAIDPAIWLSYTSPPGYGSGQDEIELRDQIRRFTAVKELICLSQGSEYENGLLVKDIPEYLELEDRVGYRAPPLKFADYGSYLHMEFSRMRSNFVLGHRPEEAEVWIDNDSFLPKLRWLALDRIPQDKAVPWNLPFVRSFQPYVKAVKLTSIVFNCRTTIAEGLHGSPRVRD